MLSCECPHVVFWLIWHEIGDVAIPQLAVACSQNELGAGVEAQLTANFGGNDDAASFGDFGSVCCHVSVRMSYFGLYGMKSEMWQFRNSPSPAVRTSSAPGWRPN